MRKGSGVIKKILLFLVLMLLGGGGWFIYSNPSARQTFEDGRWILEHRDPDLYDDVDWMEGQIVKVLDGNWVYVKIPEGFVYALRIRGLEAPTLALRLSDDTLAMGKEAKKFLEDLGLRKEMRFQAIDMSELRYGHGYIEFQGKSLVLPMIQAGMARLHRSEITHFSTEDLLELLEAEREAKRSGVGIWDASLTLDWTIGDYSETGGSPSD